MPSRQVPPLRIAAIVCAAGASTRFGTLNGGKLAADLQGQLVLTRAVEAIARQPEVVATIVAGPADSVALTAFRKQHEPQLNALGATICEGGLAERFETVQASLTHTRETLSDIDAVLVHDAARPCTPAAVFRRVIEALTDHAAVVPAIPVADTLKRTNQAHTPDTLLHQVQQTIDRRGVFACQTPQGFHLDLITRAYAQGDLASTDDAQLVERLGEPVLLVAGDLRNFKITRPEDLELARAIWPTLAI